MQGERTGIQTDLVRRFWLPVAAILAVLIAGCPADASRTATPSVPWPAATAGPSAVTLTPAQRRVADELVSVFENGTAQPRYGYVEALGDGRGYTCGKIGFTTSGTEVRDVVTAYAARRPGAALARHLPRLRELAAAHSGAVTGLGGFGRDWAAAATDAAFRAAQDTAAARLTLNPAVAAARSLGLRSALGVAILYDTTVQHGTGTDPDGLPALLTRATAAVGGRPADGVAERRWLEAFLTVRAATLRHAHDPASRRVWAESVDRVTALRQLVRADRHELTPPVPVTVFGGRHVLR